MSSSAASALPKCLKKSDFNGRLAKLGFIQRPRVSLRSDRGACPMALREGLQQSVALTATRLSSPGGESRKVERAHSTEDPVTSTVSGEERHPPQIGDIRRCTVSDPHDSRTLHQRMRDEIEAALCSDEPGTICAHVKLATDYARQLQAKRSLLDAAKSRFRQSSR